MSSLPFHLAEALLGKRHYLTLAERNLNNKYNLAAGKKKESFPRDSSASLGMTVSGALCHVELALSSRGSAAREAAET